MTERVDEDALWFTAKQFAGLRLPGIPATKRSVVDLANREGWRRPHMEGVIWRPRSGPGGGFEYTPMVLRPEARAVLRERLREIDAALSGRLPPTRRDLRGDAAREALWAIWNRASKTKKDEAARRARILHHYTELTGAGLTPGEALAVLKRDHGVGRTKLYTWLRLVEDWEQCDWWAALLPHNTGPGSKSAPLDPRAWDFLKGRWLTQAQPSAALAIRELRAWAGEQGIPLPSDRTLKRRLQTDISIQEVTLRRKGEKALKEMYPAQRRTRTHLLPMSAVNCDGHKFDVFVRWLDGEIVRPTMIAFQDLYSNKILAWRVDKTENREATRLAIGDMVEEYGIPDVIYMDNGRAFASKAISGGAPNRFRFKIRDEDLPGVLVTLGVQIVWTTPYSGQSKPIERAFRDFAANISKHAAFDGAWTGNSPEAKPENYGSRAVPFDVFLKVVSEGVAEHNSRPGRATEVCQGKFSFDDVFAARYEEAMPRRASPSQRGVWLLAAESLFAKRETGEITLHGNRYWSDWMVAIAGKRVVARYDPQDLQDDVAIYDLADKYLGSAAALPDAKFDDVDAAREHNRARRLWIRGQKMMAEARAGMAIEEIAAALPVTMPSPAPHTKVVRMVRPATAGATALKVELADREDERERAQQRVSEVLGHYYGPKLVPFPHQQEDE